jgi:hypothetical protein
MTVRTNTTAVEKVLGVDYDPGTDEEPGADLTPYIESASALVDDLAAKASAQGLTTLTASRKELIERWLAAHAYKLVDQPFAASSTGAQGSMAQATYQGKTGMYLEATKYGQMAISLDPTGLLVTLGKRLVARCHWLGRPPSEQTDYVNRD